LPILSAYEEKLLLKEVSQGNEKAFRTFYDAYFNHLSAYIFKLCKSETATEEIVQDIFLKIWVNRASLAHMDTPEAYVFSMARNKTLDYLRRLSKETNLINVLQEHLSSSRNDVEDKLNAEELRLLIEEALEQLSTQKRKIFQLSRNEGLSHDEIAEVMHLSKSTVKNHLSETLQHVREHLRHHPNSEAFLLLLILLF
jgi:RNA polymerase sigma-70 factor (ECF subfamily)